MKIIIVSDTHDNLANLKKLFLFAKKEKIKFLIHCGDVCQGETLREIEENFEEVFLSLGNADLREDLKKSAKKTKIFEKTGEIETDDLKIDFCHEFDFRKKNKDIEKFDFFFFGHTHWPFLRKEKNCYLANPGNLAGLFFKATFAILDTKERNISLKIL